MSDNQPRKYRSIATDYFSYFTTRLRRTDAQYEAKLYFNAVPFLLMSMVTVIALHDLFSMFLLRPTKSTCKLMAWGGVGKIVFIRWMLLIPAIFFTVLFTSFFATLAVQTCDDGDKFCIIELLNYKMIFVGIALGLFAMALFYAWKRRKEGSVEYLMIASLMDPNGDGRSKFLNQCKRSKDFREIVEPLSEIVEPLSEMKNKKINPKKIKKNKSKENMKRRPREPTLGEPLSAADYRKLKRNT